MVYKRKTKRSAICATNGNRASYNQDIAEQKLHNIS